MNGKVIACKHGCQAILDTGTAFLLGPSRRITKIQRLIGVRPFGMPCNTTSTLPPLIFTIKGIDYPVPAQAYIHEVRGQSPGHHSVLACGSHKERGTLRALVSVQPETSDA
uniref:Peptidase A1 domain-containing protein n=1 Tax=Moschus moschiferus TaxID=68415 RepID=A0A8C6E706_MOSMO